MDELPQLRALIFVQPGLDAGRWYVECRDYCARHGHLVVSVAYDARSVAEMWRRYEVDVIVVARPEHVRTLAYATEVVTEEDQRDHRVPRQWRRIRRRQRGSAER